MKTEGLPEGFTIQMCEEVTTVPKAVSSEVEKIWKKETERLGDKLFNGKILSRVSVDGPVWNAELRQYKDYVAQLRRPELASELNFEPLAVSGICFLDGRVVFGRRASYVAVDPNRWELIPSGGLSTSCIGNDGKVNFLAQLEQELREELGIYRKQIAKFEPLLWTQDPVSRVIDIGVRVELNAQQIPTELNEYSECRWVDGTELLNFIKEAGEEIVTVSQEIIDFLKKKEEAPS